MQAKPSFDLSAVFESTVTGLIEFFRCYVITLGLLIFRPSEYKQRVLNALKGSESDKTSNLSGPFTFLLICWFVANLLADGLAIKFGVVFSSYGFPSLREILKIEVLLIHALAPLVILHIVYGIFLLLFVVSKIKIPFYESLTLIAYPFGFWVMVCVPYPVLRQLLPHSLEGVIGFFGFWILFRRVYQCVGDFRPEGKRRLKWALLSFVVLLFLIALLLSSYGPPS